jgi:protein-S-isoprenylcysteine O-methyltransferase Ste14
MAGPPPLAHPGVRFPPPLVYVGGLVAGWLLHRWWPLAITAAPSPVRSTLGAICLAAGFGLMIAAVVTFRRARTAIVPLRPAAALVTSGPYHYTRNPMYVSLVALYLGATLLIDSWWPVLLLPLVIVVIQRLVIAREERYLTGAFPTEYPAYCRRVRRWV